MTIKLKPCPHCGSEATIAKHPIVGTTVSLWTIMCTNPKCPNSEPTSKCYLMEEAAVKAWNEEDGEGE